MPSARRPYARVYDGLPSHAKVLRIPRADRAAAMGTWVLCMSWSNEHLTDGYLPAWMVAEVGGSDAGAEALVAVGLWRRKREGYVFVNWSEHNATRDQVEKAREANRTRQQRFRQKQPTSGDNPGVDDAPVTRDRGARNRPTSTATRTRQQIDDQSLGDHTSAELETGSTGDNPGESVDSELQRIRDWTAELTQRPVHALEAADIRRHYLERAKTPPKRPTGYVLTCLTREEPIVLLNYLDTGRWSA